MIRFLADEDFNNDILRGLRRRDAAIDVVRIQDLGHAGADDATVLATATDRGRILLTHDVSTLLGFAFERVRSGKPMLGVVAVPQSVAVRAVIEDLVLIAECSEPEEWANQVRYLPLR
jgi:predicted nuclease of predicted toxin-antitoxin system